MLFNFQSVCILFLLAPTLGGWAAPQSASDEERIGYSVRQITRGPHHHFFGYIGQSKTIPWNESGRYILALRTDFHDHMPLPHEAADVVVIDTEDGDRIIELDKSHAYNFQQGTMFYWNPENPEHQFFFNDRDLSTGKVFTVLYDFKDKRRVHEFRFEEAPVANSGVAQGGGRFLAINYARMDRLRRVTGYPGAFDWTAGETAPADDGIHLVEVESGERKLLVSFREMRDRFTGIVPDVEHAHLYINHTLWNRDNDRIYFYLRGNHQGKEMKVNAPCSIRPDGTGLTFHETFIGGHPEWGEGKQVIGGVEDRQVLYDVDRKEIVGEIGPPGTFPSPGADISFSPDGKWFANGHSGAGGNAYTLYRMDGGAIVQTERFSRGPHKTGELRIDPAPCWNRTSDSVLVPGWTPEGFRQIFLITLDRELLHPEP